MKVIYTEQSLNSLEEVLKFLLKAQKMPLKRVIEIKNRLLEKADSLSTYPEIGQWEEYLEHLKKGHRRLIEGYFKIIYPIEGGNVYITDFFDSRQDPEKMKA